MENMIQVAKGALLNERAFQSLVEVLNGMGNWNHFNNVHQELIVKEITISSQPMLFTTSKS